MASYFFLPQRFSVDCWMSILLSHSREFLKHFIEARNNFVLSFSLITKKKNFKFNYNLESIFCSENLSNRLLHSQVKNLNEWTNASNGSNLFSIPIEKRKDPFQTEQEKRQKRSRRRRLVKDHLCTSLPVNKKNKNNLHYKHSSQVYIYKLVSSSFFCSFLFVSYLFSPVWFWRGHQHGRHLTCLQPGLDSGKCASECTTKKTCVPRRLEKKQCPHSSPVRQHRPEPSSSL